MKSIFALLTFLMFCLTPALQAQFFCGMSATDCNMVKEQMLKNREEMRDFSHDRNAVTYVPVRFFLVADSDGSGRGTESSCMTALCNLNLNYAELEIHFYLKEFKYLDNGDIYDDPMDSGFWDIWDAMEYNAINVFVVQEPGGGAAAYYQPPASGPSRRDWVVCAKQYMGDARVLTHEFGHFLSLPHPFNGWEPPSPPDNESGWNLTAHGNPVNQFWAPDGSTQVELVNGSNCTVAGDAICDTPADYMFPSGNCTYNDGVMDKNDELLEPQLENYMNYHFGCDNYFFTEGQKDEIINSLFSSSRNYIRPNYDPNTAEITDDINVIAPEHNEDLTYHQNVYLHWEAVEGADSYILDIFSGVLTIREVVHTNYRKFTNELPANKTFLWKVLPYNEGYPCSNFSSTFKFRTGEGVNNTDEIDEVSEFQVIPNPVYAGSNINVSVTSSTNFEATVSLVSMTGQVISTFENYEFKTGNASLEIETNDLSAGVYFVNIQSENGVLNKKIILSK